MTTAKKTTKKPSEPESKEEYPYRRSLDRDDRGLEVMWVQSKLMKAGCYEGELDGRFDYEMTKAVRQFQSNAGLMITGVVDRKTWAAIVAREKD